MEIQSYTLKETAKVLKIHPETLRLKARDGEITSFRINGDYRFTEVDIKEYQDRNRTK